MGGGADVGALRVGFGRAGTSGLVVSVSSVALDCAQRASSPRVRRLRRRRVNKGPLRPLSTSTPCGGRCVNLGRRRGPSDRDYLAE